MYKFYKLVCLFSSKIKLKVNDNVLVRFDRVGKIQYIGHLDKIGSPSLVYVGLELETGGFFYTSNIQTQNFELN